MVAYDALCFLLSEVLGWFIQLEGIWLYTVLALPGSAEYL